MFPSKILLNIDFVSYEENLGVGCSLEGLPEFFNLITGKLMKPKTTHRIKEHQVICLALHSRW